MERSDYTLHTQVEAKHILYRDMVMVHTTWINRMGRYDITLTPPISKVQTISGAIKKCTTNKHSRHHLSAL